MELLIFYLILALAVSFLCSITEAVILSVTTPFIKTQELKGKAAAETLKNLKAKIDRPLSAILSVNTVAHTIGAAGVGAQAVAIFGDVYFGVISAILTLLILIFSEIIPKTIGARYWRSLALPLAGVIKVMIYISYPLVVMSDFITKLLSKNRKPPTISRDEVAAIAHLGMKEGILEENESQIISNLVKLKAHRVNEIMTPRTVVVSAPENLTIKKYMEVKPHLRFSRIPVFSENSDNITGYVLNSDILDKLTDNETETILSDIKRSIMSFYENISIPRLFNEFLIKREHIALIINEHGGTEGIVTMEDVIESLLGLDIVDERDIETNMRELAKKRWELKLKRYEELYSQKSGGKR